MDVKKAVKPDGGLYLNSGGWMSWSVGDDKITLDAEFTIEQLEFIVAHMKAAQQGQADGAKGFRVINNLLDNAALLETEH